MALGERVYVGDMQESIHFVKLNMSSSENQLVVYADDSVPRHLTTFCMLDYDTICGSDKFGNIFVLRLPSDVSDDIDNPTGSKMLWDTGILNGAPSKLEQVCVCVCAGVCVVCYITGISVCYTTSLVSVCVVVCVCVCVLCLVCLFLASVCQLCSGHLCTLISPSALRFIPIPPFPWPKQDLPVPHWRTCDLHAENAAGSGRARGDSVLDGHGEHRSTHPVPKPGGY